MSSGWTQTKIVLDGFFDLLACGKCKKTPERPMRYNACGHFFCDTCIHGETTCFQCKISVRPNDTQPYRTVAQLIEYCHIIKDVIAEIKPEDLKPLTKAVQQFAAERKGVVPETDSESEDEVVQSTPPDRRSCAKKNINSEVCAPSCIDPASQRNVKNHPEPESAGYVEPTQLTQRRAGKSFEPESAGYVDPTQFTQRRAGKIIEPESSGYVDPTQFERHGGKENFEPETASYVDPTQMEKNRVERDAEEKIAEHANRPRTPTDRKNEHFPAKTCRFSAHPSMIQQRSKNSMPKFIPRAGSFAAQMPKLCEKSHSQLAAAEYVDPREKNRSKTCREISSPELIEPAPLHKRDGSNLSTETAGYVEATQANRFPAGNVTETESAEFIDPTPICKRHDVPDQQPETSGYRDPTQKAEISATKKAIDSRSSNDERIDEIDDSRAKNSPNDWYEEMDTLDGTDDAEKNFSRRETNGNLIAPESVDMDPNTFAKIVVPESLENLDDESNFLDSPMEIENSRTERVAGSAKFTNTTISSTKIPNIDRNTSRAFVSEDTPTVSTKTRDETPFEQLRRIRSLALSRRSKIRKNFHRSDASMEIREKSPEKKVKIDENLTLHRREKIATFPGDASTNVAVGQIFPEETTEFFDKTPRKTSREARKNSPRGEKKSSTNVRDNPSFDIPMDSLVETFGTKEIDASRAQDLAREGKNLIDDDDEVTRAIGIEERKKLPQTRREKESLRQLRSVENLNNEIDAAGKFKEKLVDSRSRRGVDKTRTAAPKAIPKNLNKRNAKGETPLHTACVKGQNDHVKALLEAGSNPNTKDNANWTPLQEAVNLGHRRICKMLLQAGASANTPGMENRTALHDASANDKPEEAALLLRFNANKNVYDKFGRRPIDYAVSDEMRALLADNNEIERNVDDISCLDSTLDQSITVPNAKVIVLPSNLSNKNRKLLAQLASKLKVEVATSFRPTVTHVVVETNERNITKLTYYVMLAILQGKWILNSQWITVSTDLNDISEIDLELFEVRGAPNPETPTRARINEEKQNPRLFNNCFFYFAIGPRCAWSYEKFEFTKESLTSLVLGGQGEILNREPDPEDVRDCRLAPFHVAHRPTHPLHRCSHYIIYMPGKDEPRVKYNMPHIKSLPVGWFLECIEKFALVDPQLMGIS